LVLDYLVFGVPYGGVTALSYSRLRQVDDERLAKDASLFRMAAPLSLLWPITWPFTAPKIIHPSPMTRKQRAQLAYEQKKLEIDRQRNVESKKTLQLTRSLMKTLEDDDDDDWLSPVLPEPEEEEVEQPEPMAAKLPKPPAGPGPGAKAPPAFKICDFCGTEYPGRESFKHTCSTPRPPAPVKSVHSDFGSWKECKYCRSYFPSVTKDDLCTTCRGKLDKKAADALTCYSCVKSHHKEWFTTNQNVHVFGCKKQYKWPERDTDSYPDLEAKMDAIKNQILAVNAIPPGIPDPHWHPETDPYSGLPSLAVSLQKRLG
jgi:hypothetical protein